MKTNQTWAVSDVNQLLLPNPLRMEMGIERDKMAY